MRESKCLVATGGLANLSSVGPAAAQAEFTVCRSQQSLEQVLETAGSLEPDDCQPARISRLGAKGGSVCVFHLSGDAETLLGEFRELAETEEWRMPCDALGPVLSD